ncbi:hypothetical protein B0H67DRAFT_671321 [Lasiosphaeris hirsuta]|uniref:Uncharacterized protein n=1 Tax=Lasiosphaeris hirsuta TaxID=260670 RepID=A0AA40A246_9PEZI|nr:hypothetical protein B0H67DRAFT_671321 [Lasiosphaeris hirsuta]
MAAVAQIYNTLPTLGDANARFVDREPTLRELADLLAQYGNIFGICLVHSHCKLADGEICSPKGTFPSPNRIGMSSSTI